MTGPAVGPDTVDWPALPYAEWSDTCTTLHLWTQVAGKIALALSPLVNHWWGAALVVTPRGLATHTLRHGARPLRLEFDFRAHALVIQAAGADDARVALEPRSVADFHAEVMARMDELGCPVHILTTPSEIADGIPFELDEEHASYDRDAVETFRRALVGAQGALEAFRAPWLGKASPVHFFWGSFDLALTRFSGRVAPPHRGGVPAMPDWVTREAYSHEVWSAGWWPGSESYPHAAFYAYAYPTPDGLAEATVEPAAAHWSRELGEFLLRYDDARAASDTSREVARFLETTYHAVADLAGWDRVQLERKNGELEHLEPRQHAANRPVEVHSGHPDDVGTPESP